MEKIAKKDVNDKAKLEFERCTVQRRLLNEAEGGRVNIVALNAILKKDK